METSVKLVCAAGTEIADGQGKVEGQPLGMPGIWQGASSEQGTFSEAASGIAWEAFISGIIGAPDSCTAIASIPPALGIANARPPTTTR